MKKPLIIFLFIPFLVLESGGLSFAQSTTVIDSLNNLLQTAEEDTTKAKALGELVWSYIYSNPDTAFTLAQKEYQLAKRVAASPVKALAKAGKKLMVDALIKQGASFYMKGDYPKALEYYYKSLKIAEEIEDEKTKARVYNNMGMIYDEQDKHPKALEYYHKSLKIKEELGDKMAMASTYINIGGVYYQQGDYLKALEYYHQSLKITEKLGDKNKMAYTYNNIGLIYWKQGDYPKALDYYYQSLKITEDLGNKAGLTTIYNNIGKLYTLTGEYVKALENLSIGLNIAKEIGALLREKETYESLTELYEKQKNYQKAYEYHQLYSEIKDSLFNEESSKQIAEMQEKYESEKREKEIELLNKEKELQTTELNRQKIIIWSGAGGLLLVIALAFFIYRGDRQKQKANVLLAAQKQVIETKNKDITDSIRYAERIQAAILPTDEQIKELLPDSFVLFKPKDIVSGDFYWVAALDSQESPPAGGRGVLIAACDCTGHGVPGAFMSMMINSLLNEVVNDLGITKPNEILYEVRKGIINSLKQKGESGDQKDGMDAALCSIDFENMKLEYAGANNPLYLIRKGELQQIRADKQPVGFHMGEQTPFTNHEIQLKKGDTIYIFSDGYQDQFGGSRGKKYMSKRFRQLFIDVQTMNMDEQKEHLDKTIEEWKGDREQVDDILVIGVRV
ncbi:tetratricopeptide repeat protein [bacterium AH-315-M05]|nr:tetratricopeptide repeat protein [bacterium AH-315-M05]